MKKTTSNFFISLLLACVMFFTISLSGCAKYEDYIESGDFIYKIVEDENGEKTAELRGFSKIGRAKAGVILPETIDGYKVSLVASGYWTPKNEFGVIRLYILNEFTFSFPNDIRQEKVLKFNVYNNELPIPHYGSMGPGDGVFTPDNEDGDGKRANLSYMYNYEDAPHEGTYWIDDYDGTTIKFIPPEPVRKGYTFEGWHKDEECTEKWDFEKDIISEKEYDIDKRYDSTEYKIYIYKNNKLYAKWRKNA